MTALPQSGTFAQVDPTHVAAIGPAAALLYARIMWRADKAKSGRWRASRRDLAQETGLSDAMLRTAVRILRDQGWVSAERTSSDDSTLIWRPLCPSDQHMDVSAPPPVESTITPCGIVPTPPGKSPIPSTQTVDTNTNTHTAVGVVASDNQSQLFAVPDPVPPQNAGTLVARWVDGYRETNDGTDPPGPLMKRVAGQMKNLAKVCESDADWGAAWRASFAAGRAGRADAVPLMAKQQQRTSGRARNVFIDPELGGPGQTAVAGVAALLASSGPRAVGGRS